jgi:GTPase SAR1 family protein
MEKEKLKAQITTQEVFLRVDSSEDEFSLKYLQAYNTDLESILCEETEWEYYGLDPNKSILLFGLSRIGKTTILSNYLRKTLKNVGHFVQPEDFIRFSQVGPELVYKFATDHCFIDDLGAESYPLRFYGTEYPVVQDIIMKRDLVFPRLRTCITTNLTPPKILERYGERVFFRLIKMCNWINVGGERYLI